MQAFKIIVDNRERNLDILQSLSDFGIDLSFAQLPVGDYIVSDRICVERKTVADFENSIIDNRLFEQLGRLKESFEKPILIIEGYDGDYRLNSNVIMGTVLKLYLDYNVQVINSISAEETAVILSKFAEREQGEDRREPRVMGLKKAHTTYQWQVMMLSSVPGIGPSLAHGLLKHFKTIKSIAIANVDGLMEVDRVGRKKAEAIYKVINSEFGDEEHT
ncbi:MAG: ERCC4 domain-containing protein [Candidatus Micrarchaeaceae archaeon]